MEQATKPADLTDAALFDQVRKCQGEGKNGEGAAYLIELAERNLLRAHRAPLMKKQRPIEAAAFYLLQSLKAVQDRIECIEAAQRPTNPED